MHKVNVQKSMEINPLLQQEGERESRYLIPNERYPIVLFSFLSYKAV